MECVGNLLLGEVGRKGKQNTAARDIVPKRRKTPLKQGTVLQNRELLDHVKLVAKENTGLWATDLVSELDARRSINVTGASLVPT